MHHGSRSRPNLSPLLVSCLGRPISSHGLLMAASAVSTFVCVGVLNFQMTGIPNVCEPTQKDKFTCPSINTFFTASVLWGTLGPKKMFGGGAIYNSLLYCFLIGAGEFGYSRSVFLLMCSLSTFQCFRSYSSTLDVGFPLCANSIYLSSLSVASPGRLTTCRTFGRRCRSAFSSTFTLSDGGPSFVLSSPHHRCR